MRKVMVSEFVSLDGVIEDPGGGESFEHGGWTRSYWGDDIARFKLEELLASDALLLGRKTYQGFAAAWPSMRDEEGFADRMNSLPKYVVSNTLKELGWNNSKLITGDIAEGVAQLKGQTGGNILLSGSATLAQTLAEAGLVDEYRLLVYPVVLGSGKRLFAPGGDAKLKLTDVRPFASGVAALVYETLPSST
jgi:dihydrofolate reductase